jgi:hypothetical protein
MQIDSAKNQILRPAKRMSRRMQQALALLAPLAFLVALPGFAQSVVAISGPPLYAQARSLPGVAEAAEIDAPQPQPSVDNSAGEPTTALAVVPHD